MVRPTTRTSRIATAIAALTVAALTVSSSVTAEETSAFWVDPEWVSSQVGTLDCEVGSDQFSSRASGDFLSGEVLSLNLDDVADVRGITVQNTGADLAIDPAPPASDPAGDDAYVNPLDVSALTAVNAQLGNLLALPLNSDVGAVNNYAQARDNGLSVAAAGSVNNTGAIQLAPVAPGAEPPTIATVELGQILSTVTGSGLGGGIASLANARLNVGAVASTATLDACAAEWSDSVYDNLARDYLIAALGLEVDTPLVAATVADTQTTLGGVASRINALSGNSGVLASVTSGVTNLVSGLLSTLRLGSVSISNLTATLDLSAVTALLDDTISDDAETVAIDLAAGTVDIDLDALLGSVYGTEGVNGLEPNTPLLVNSAVVTALTAATTEALSNWVDDVTAALSVALRSATVGASVVVPLLGVGSSALAIITLTIPPTSLATLLSGSVRASSSLTLLGGTCGVLNPVGCLLNTVVGAVVGPLTNGIGKVLGDALNSALFSTATGGILSSTTAALTTLSTPLLRFVGDATSGLFGENSVVSLTANAQNSPDLADPSGSDLPEWASELPGPDSAAKSSGQYDVSALRLSTLGILGSELNVDLNFARSSVGSNTVIN
ncbi:MAG TPA: choice-of-anchor G family protein [Glaciihabitans sp.]|jgi:hypothetical protein|nr:choice-of-anchor G family protein [Glaciihabitans sp.]